MKQVGIFFIVVALLASGYFISGCAGTKTTPSLSKIVVSLDNNDISADTGLIGVTITATDQNGNGMSGLTPVILLDPKSLGGASTPIDLGTGTYIVSLSNLRIAGNFTVTAEIGNNSATADFKVEPGALNVNTTTLNVFPTTIAADGASSADLTIMLLDSFDNPISSGYKVTYTTGTDPTIASAVFTAASSTSGAFTGTITSTTIGTLYISGYITSSSLSFISQKAMVFFTIPTISMSITAPAVWYINQPYEPGVTGFNAYVRPAAIDSGNLVSGLSITSYVSNALHPGSWYLVNTPNTPETPAGSGIYTNQFLPPTNNEIERITIKAINLQTSANAVASVTFSAYTTAQTCSGTTSNPPYIPFGDGATVTTYIKDYTNNPLKGYNGTTPNTLTNITMTTSGAYLTTTTTSCASSSSCVSELRTNTWVTNDGCGNSGYSATFDSNASGTGTFTVDLWANGIRLTSTTIKVQ